MSTSKEDLIRKIITTFKLDNVKIENLEILVINQKGIRVIGRKTAVKLKY